MCKKAYKKLVYIHYMYFPPHFPFPGSVPAWFLDTGLART